MKQLFLILSLSCFVAFFAASQSAQSDSLFAKGVELYNARKYKEAIPFFEESDKLDKAQLDSTSNRRIYSSMWIASCYYKLNDEINAKRYDEHYKESPVDRRKTVQSDSLTQIALNFFNEERYNEALNCFLECAEIEENEAGKDSWFLSNTLYYISHVYTNLKQHEKAIAYKKRVLEIYTKKGYDQSASFSVILNQLALDYNALKDHENAIKTIQRAFEEGKKSYGDSSYNYALILSNAGLCHKSAEKYGQAASYYKQAASILKSLDASDFSYVRILAKEAQCLFDLGEYEEASQICKEILPRYKDMYGKESGQYLFILEGLHDATKRMGKYEEAKVLCDECIAIRVGLFGNSGTGLAQMYREQAENLVALTHFKDAIRYASKSVDLFKAAKGEQDVLYSSGLAYLGYCYSYDKQYEKAIEIVKESIGIRRTTMGEDDPNFVTSVLNLGTYYKELHEYEKAMECGKFVVEKRKKIYGENHKEYAEALSWLAEFYNNEGNYSKAIELEEKACEIMSEKKDADYIRILGSLASYYSNNGDNNKAIEIGIQSLNLGKRILGSDNNNYIILHENLGNFYYNEKQYEKAIEMVKEAIELRRATFGEDDPRYVSSFLTLGKYYNEIHDYEKAMECGRFVVEKRKEIYGDSHLEYAQALSWLGVFYDSQGYYKDAIELEDMACKIFQQTDSISYLLSIWALAGYCTRYGDYKKANDLYAKSLELYKTTKGEQSKEYRSVLGRLVDNNMKISNFEDAIHYQTSLIQSYRDNYNDSLSMLNLKMELAQILGFKGDYNEALMLAKETVQSIRARGKDEQYASSLMTLGSLYIFNDQIEEGLDIVKEAIMELENMISDDDPLYGSALCTLARIYISTKHYDDAINVLNRALPIFENNQSKQTENYYIDVMRLLGSCYSALQLTEPAIGFEIKVLNYMTEKKIFNNDYAQSLQNLSNYLEYEDPEESIRYGKRVLDYYETRGMTESLNYVTSLAALAGKYANIKDYTRAINLYEKALPIYEYKPYAYKDYVYVLGKLAECYCNIDDVDKAFDNSSKALNILRLMHENNSRIDYANALVVYADVAKYMGDYKSSQNCYTKAAAILANLKGMELFYSDALFRMSILEDYLGNYEKGLSLINQAIEITKYILGEEGFFYIQLLNAKSIYLSSIGQNEEALSCLIEAKKICEDKYIYRDTYVEVLNSYAVLQFRLKNVDEALINIYKAMEICRELEVRDSTSLYNNAALFHAQKGEFDKAFTMGLISLNQQKKRHSKDEPAILKMTEHLIDYSYHLGDYNVTKDYLLDYFDILKSFVCGNIFFANSNSRSKFWEKYILNNKNIIPSYSYLIGNKELYGLGYNWLLFSKGQLLNVENTIYKSVIESKNPKVKHLYDKIQEYHSNEIQQFQNYGTSDSISVLSNELEKLLEGESTVSKNIFRKMDISWEDIKNRLSDNDLCIEFAKLNLDNNKVLYVAYLLKKRYTHPIMVPLFEEKNLTDNMRELTEKNVSQIIWKPLDSILVNTKNIFFAPDGELYNIPIEHLPHWNEDFLISDKFNLFRLSSTRELATPDIKNNVKKASIYGGIRYDTDTDLLLADSRKYRKTERSFGIIPFEKSDSVEMRSGVAYLPETLKEAEDIDKFLEQMNITTSLRTDTLATEGDFKSLSGKNTNLMHVATHGFYWTEREAKLLQDMDFITSEDRKYQYIEDKALTRSGLLLAGANNALTGKTLPDGVNDGILTAQEISQLNLQGLDLVVLSACQTGLGEIKGDGVFGLQRGFKKAGANSIMMSLWKVDDTATRMLMVQFYKNLTSGMSKHESLKQAQKYLREYEVEVEEAEDSPHQISAHAKEQARKDTNREKTTKKVKKYQDPYYWAGFILLDALN